VPPVHRPIDDVISATPLFAIAARSTIDGLARSAHRRTLQRNEVLFTVGGRATAMHVIDSGTLRVFASSAEGTEPTLALVHAGETVGELGVLEDVPRSASVAAVERSSIVEVPARAFRTAYDSDPAIARRMVSMLAQRLRTVTDGLADLAYLDLGGRLAKYLVRESERQGRTTFRLPLTQAELGQLLGGARQTVNQVGRSLERDGLVVLEGRTVRILDEQGLRARASSSGGRFD
jgi:CRP/FNR family cyclic AMP-dependent transcriptional regulator